MIIYKTIFPNGKIYIGQDKNNNPYYFGSGTACLDAIKRFGKSCLKKVVLMRCNNQSQLDKAERLFIKKFDSTNRKVGYNILPGTSNKFGAGSPMNNPNVVKKVSKSLKKMYKTKKGESLRQNLSNKQIERFKIKENRDLLSERLKGKMIGENNPNYGNKWDEDQKSKMSEIKKGLYKKQKNPMSGKKRITNGKHNTVIEAGQPLPKGYRFGLARGLK